MQIDLALKGNNIFLPGGIRKGIVLTRGGVIVDILDTLDYSIETQFEDAGDLLVTPGIIDPHVHINEPGRTEWEGFETATKAAAAGGVTTLIDMPLNSAPVTTNAVNFQLKLEAAKGKLNVNCGFWGGVIPGNTNQLEELLESGVMGLKAFLTHSGIDDFPNASREDLYKALLILKKYDKPLLVHCELDTPHDDQVFLENQPRSYEAWLKSRPKKWENEAIKMMIDLCRQTEGRVHIVHLSSAEALPMIEEAKRDGLPLTVETGQHYLYFNAEEIMDGDTRFKCAPPIREKENNDKLWEALGSGLIDFIATDHSPATPKLKEIDSGDFKKSWGGIAGLQFSLPVVWTAARQRGFTLNDVMKWLCINPARFLKLDSRKGKIQKGFDADFVLWDTNAKFKVEANAIHHRHKVTPYEGLELSGVVNRTFVNGFKVYDKVKFINLNKGKILKSY